MRDLTAVCGAPIIFQRAGLAPRAGNVSGEASKHHRTGPPIGLGLQGPFSWVGVAPPFGRLDAVALARFADAVGTDDICLTPWRTLLAPGLDEGAAQRLWAELSIDASGLITNPADPRLNVAACSGAPACIRATTPVQADAALLAKAVPYQGGIAVHVSGCAKGCAHAQAAPMTLVGRDAAYDLVRNGKAGAMPVLRGLPIAELVAMLEHDPAHSLEGGASVKLQEHLF
jgi:sulfite reductase beta subunit-like hemoprotein